MSINAGLMSSATDQWATPQELFEELDREFAFETDVCAEDWNHKCEQYFTPADDGLAQEWSGVCWMNPPYGREIGTWMRKAFTASQGGGDRRVPHPSQNRHRLVARLRHARRNPILARPSQV